jgi:hypothetical protein
MILAFIVQIVKDLNPPPVVKIDLPMMNLTLSPFRSVGEQLLVLKVLTQRRRDDDKDIDERMIF